MNVYLAVLVLNPTEKQKYDDGTVPQVVGGGPHVVIASDDKQAAAKAMKYLPAEHEGKEDRVEVLVMPFRRAGA